MRAFFKLIAILKSWWGRNESSCRALTIAGIHATVLTILIGITSGYYIFARDKIYEMEVETQKEAEKINQVLFAYSYYHPSPDDFSKNKDPRNIEQAINLGSYLHALLSEGEANLPGMEIPKMPADRAERALQIMNLLVHRYPFQESISVDSSLPPKRLFFKNRAEIAKWSDDLEKLLGSMYDWVYRWQKSIGPSTKEYFQALNSRNEALIKKWNRDFDLRRRGYVDTALLFEDFIQNFQRADEISHSVKFYLDKVDMLERRLVPKKQICIGIGLVFLAFFCGVVLPLFIDRIRQVFLLWVPCGFYIIGFYFLVRRLLM